MVFKVISSRQKAATALREFVRRHELGGICIGSINGRFVFCFSDLRRMSKALFTLARMCSAPRDRHTNPEHQAKVAKYR